MPDDHTILILEFRRLLNQYLLLAPANNRYFDGNGPRRAHAEWQRNQDKRNDCRRRLLAILPELSGVAERADFDSGPFHSFQNDADQTEALFALLDRMAAKLSHEPRLAGYVARRAEPLDRMEAKLSHEPAKAPESTQSKAGTEPAKAAKAAQPKNISGVSGEFIKYVNRSLSGESPKRGEIRKLANNFLKIHPKCGRSRATLEGAWRLHKKRRESGAKAAR